MNNQQLLQQSFAQQIRQVVRVVHQVSGLSHKMASPTPMEEGIVKLSRVLLRMPELTSQWTQNWNPGPMATGSWQDSQSLCCLHQRCNRLHFLHNGNIADSFWGHLMPEQSQPNSTNLRYWKQPFGQEQRLRSCATSLAFPSLLLFVAKLSIHWPRLCAVPSKPPSRRPKRIGLGLCL